MVHDVVIVGAGPAGLSLAGMLAPLGLDVALVERQAAAALAEPGFDGREIALTHASVALLQGLGAWDGMAADSAPLRAARVLNGDSRFALSFHGNEALGCLVPNQAIRRALFAALPAGVTLLDQAKVTAVAPGEVTLEDGRRLAAKLVVAADTRFSETRRRMGIAAAMRDFGKVMLVCRVNHEAEHDQVALEWFDHGQTLALLPLRGRMSSAVITVPAPEAEWLLAMEERAFGEEVTRRYRGRLGAMTLAGSRHGYPLVAVYANRFVGPGLALAGDAAVGMHPVTAHGFNFGLAGARRLARALRQGGITPASLARYEREHRRGTHPMWLATNAIAMLFSDERRPARAARHAALRLGHALPFFRQAVARRLTALA